MTRSEYISVLSRLIKKLPEKDQEYIIYDYEEYFSAGLQDGKSEEKICKFLGNPKVVAKQYLADYSLRQADQNASVQNVFKASYAMASLGFISFIVVMPILIIFFGVILSLFVLSITLTVKGIVTAVIVILSFISPSIAVIGVDRMVEVFLSIGIASAGLLIFMTVIWLVKVILRNIVKLLKVFHAKLRTGGIRK